MFILVWSENAMLGNILVCVLDLLAVASKVRRIILEKVVSTESLVVSISMKPFLLSVPANTLSPLCLSFGIGSPVMVASSMVVSPMVILPSSGIKLPGFT